MIDTKALAKPIANDPTRALSSIRLKEDIDEAIAPLLAELERLRGETSAKDAVIRTRDRTIVDGRASDRERDKCIQAMGEEIALLRNQLAATSEAHRISDREREVEDLAKKQWVELVAYRTDAEPAEAFTSAVKFISERDRRRAERKEQSNG